MSKFKAYFNALRARTLPLSASGVVVGSLLALADLPKGLFSVATFIFAVLTTISLQVLTNFSNDLGDAIKGADTENSNGPRSSIISGDLSIKDYRRMIIFMILFCMISGTLLVYFAFGSLFKIESIIMLILGAFAIIAAMKYTLGDNNYGYKGWGDISVFIFFGLLSTFGGYFLLAHTLKWSVLLPATAMGLLITGVLNVNNIRDIEGDKKVGKNTLIVKIGIKWGRVYHAFLIIGAWICLVAYTILNFHNFWNLCYLTLFPVHIIHLIQVFQNEGNILDKQLELLSISIIFVAAAFAASSLVL